MPKAINRALNFQYYSLLLLLVIIPLTITTLTYNRTGLPKSAALQIFGTIYLRISKKICCSRQRMKPKKPGEITLTEMNVMRCYPLSIMKWGKQVKQTA